MRRLRATTSHAVLRWMVVLLPLASVVAFSTCARHHSTMNPSSRRLSALSSEYDSQSSSTTTTSLCTSSALFRRHSTSSVSSLLSPRYAAPLKRRRWSRQAIRATATNSQSSSSSSESEPASKLRQVLAISRTTFQAILRVCDRPLSQLQQWSLLLAFYLFHLMVLSQNTLLFGWQLIPNNKGHFCSVGWDS